jgi:hypothetical protein
MNVCPDELRTINRRKELARIRRTKEYRDIVEERVRGKTCIWCGRSDHLTIHHVSISDYISEKAYISGLDKGWVMCNSCHRAYHSGRILCPICKERYTKYNTCYQCMPQERKDEIVARKVRMKLLRRKLQKESRARFLKKGQETFGK